MNEENIVDKECKTFAINLLTVCLIVLDDGSHRLGESKAESKPDDHFEGQREAAYDDAVSKI